MGWAGDQEMSQDIFMAEVLGGPCNRTQTLPLSVSRLDSAEDRAALDRRVLAGEVFNALVKDGAGRSCGGWGLDLFGICLVLFSLPFSVD